MNGVHDMGGMQSFGPINPEPENEEPVFHAEWERRIFALTLAAGALGQWNIDKSRYARESQAPAQYLRNSYYETWLAGLETLLVENGLVSADELASGRPGRPAAPQLMDRMLKPDAVAAALARGDAFRMDDELPARFMVGEQVRVRNEHPLGHTRAPRYARGREGVVDRDHGVFVFADESAAGNKVGQHCYSVRFSAQELWGEDASPQDCVFIDLWDDHLETP
jgi:nitrile hydratase